MLVCQFFSFGAASHPHPRFGNRYINMLTLFLFVLSLSLSLSDAAPLRGLNAADDANNVNDPYAHHKIKHYRMFEGELLEITEETLTLAERRETTQHCANPWKGGENFAQTKARYDLRADPAKQSSDATLEGTFRARCIPVDGGNPENTPLTDQCLKESECFEDKGYCKVTLGDCPPRAHSTAKAPRW